MKKHIFLLIFAITANAGTMFAIEGELCGAFTINSNGDQIRFSKGNLQYHCANHIWQFAERQDIFIGNGNAYISSTYDGWIDLFGWGTGNAPTKVSQEAKNYSTFSDWGINAISNGGNITNQWRTLTRDEWVWLFCSRTNAATLFGLGSVNGVNGVIILPDNWKKPSGASFVASSTKGLKRENYASQGACYNKTEGDFYSYNTYTTEQWAIMEQAGAVFLPTAGWVGGVNISGLNTSGWYWCSTYGGPENMRPFTFDQNTLYPEYCCIGPQCRLSVRLVRLIKEHTITWLNANSSLIDQTIVEYGEMPTHTIPNKPSTAEYTYTFKGWTPEVVAVTGNATYTAVFDSVKNVYEVKWLNADGSELSKDSLEYGAMPEYNDLAPTKDSTNTYAYTFAGWMPNIVTVTGDTTYIAKFDSVKIVYPVDLTPTDPNIEINGSVDITGTPNYGDTITLTPQPEDGYYFDSWSDGNTDNPREIEVTGDVNVYPIFKQCEEIIVNISQVIYKGCEFDFNGTPLSKKGTYYDTIPLANGCDSVIVLKLNVTKAPTYNLRVVVNDEAMGSVTGAGTFTAGQQVTITAMPASSKYIFVRWYNEDEGIDVYENPYTFTLNRNLQIRAVFRKAPRR